MYPSRQLQHRIAPRHSVGGMAGACAEVTGCRQTLGQGAANRTPRPGAEDTGSALRMPRAYRAGRGRTIRRGFSLSEVLVALTLFTLLVVAVGQNISNNMRALAQMNSGGWDTPSMRAIREHILNRGSRQEIEDGGEIELAGWPKPGDRSNTTASQPTKVRWTGEVNPTSTLDLYTLTIDLQLDNSEEPLETSFVVHVYRPGWGRLEDRERMVEAKVERLEALRTARGEKRKENQ